MNTYLGAAQELTPDDIDAAQVAASRILYLEGYLWDPKSAKQAFVKASTIAHDAGRQVALTLSDAFCVDRYRGEFLDLMRNGTVDLVFANEAELHSLYQTSDFDTALKQFRSDIALGVVTRSERGCVVASKDGVIAVPAFPVERVRGHDWRRRPVRRRLPVRAGAQCRPRKRRPLRRARGGRNHPAHRCPAAGLVEGIGEEEWTAGVGAYS